MTTSAQGEQRFRAAFLILLTLAVSALFVRMILGFISTLLLAAILSGLSYPLYSWLVRLFRGRRAPASTLTILAVVLIVIIPLTAFLGILVSHAIAITQQIAPWVQQQVEEPSRIENWLRNLPFAERLAPYEDLITTKLAQLASTVGSFLVNSVAAMTRGTASFLFHLFVMLYAMFFFLIDGKAMLAKLLRYMPITPEEESLMTDKFLSVSRATLKGTLVIGVAQGTLAGLALAAAGIKGAVFWGTIMFVLSIIPAVGTGLVWVPAVIYLFAVGRTGAAIGVFLWCIAVVGTVDNILRPWLVGKDTQMPDLLIMLATLGGLVVFGAIGVVIGPIVAALFVTVWELYGLEFKGFLSRPAPSSEQGQVRDT
jgi:predicted PurR-regulated permease PerM